jgi:uncharacterized protein (DUF2336 family)
MDLSFLDKSSKVMPMLVRLYDGHKLYSLAKDKKPLARAELSSAVVELLENCDSPREEELIADVLIGLIRQAELDLKEALSERLSVMNNIPLRVALHLANENITVAEPILKNSGTLGDMDLIYIIKSKTSEYWRSIAARSSMSDQVINVLAGTRDNPTAQALVENMNIVIPQPALTIITEMAEKSEILARPLLSRPEITSDIASKLYRFVGQELKKFISQNYQINTSALLDVVDDIVLEFNNIEASEFTPTMAMTNAAFRYKEKELLSINLMIANLRRGQIQSFIAQFAVYTDLPTAIIEEVLGHQKGQGLAILCKAFHIEKQDFVTIFLLTSRVRQKGGMIDTTDISKVSAIYDRVTPDLAMRIVKASFKKKP